LSGAGDGVLTSGSVFSGDGVVSGGGVLLGIGVESDYCNDYCKTTATICKKKKEKS
jgi:hypothetical protein